MIKQLGSIALALAIGGCSVATAFMEIDGISDFVSDFDSFEYVDP